MNLHNEVMNLNISGGFDYSEFESKVIAYKCGHRDARHAAAELSLKAEARIEELEEALKNMYKNGLKQAWMDKYETDMIAAKKALENKE